MSSELPLIADIARHSRHVSKVPTTDVRTTSLAERAAFTCEPPMGMHRPQSRDMHLPVHRKAIGPKGNSTIARSALHLSVRREMRNGVCRKSNVLRMMQRSGPGQRPVSEPVSSVQLCIQSLTSRLTLAAAQAEKGRIGE